MLNTLQLAFEWVRRVVTNLWPRSQRQCINCCIPWLPHTDSSALGCGNIDVPRAGRTSQQEPLQPSSPICPGLSSKSPSSSKPPRACQDLRVLEPSSSAVPSGPSPVCCTCPVPCCLFAVWLFQPKMLGITEVT